jgi:hypothetical protein
MRTGRRLDASSARDIHIVLSLLTEVGHLPAHRASKELCHVKTCHFGSRLWMRFQKAMKLMRLQIGDFLFHPYER